MSNNTKSQQPKLKLYYFDIKGKGEAIRLLCAYANLTLEDYRLQLHDRTEFQQLKENGTLPFGQVPLLEVDDGQMKHKLVQSCAILRYLGKLAGLYPSSSNNNGNDDILAAQIDAVMDQATDAFVGTTVVTYSTRFGIVLDEIAKTKSCTNIGKDVTPRHLTYVEKLLQESTTGWLVNTTQPSPADFIWYGHYSMCYWVGGFFFFWFTVLKPLLTFF